jgi:hypothetical protein
MAEITFGTWRDRLLDATFRGVPFKISKHKYNFGRRTKVYELWNSDNASVYDQGGKAETFELDGYVLQNAGNSFDYWKEKLALVDALRKRGYGILMHPYLGKLYVSVHEEQSLEESLDEGGIAIFKMKFVQNRAPVITSYALAQSANVQAAAAKATGAAADSVASAMAGPRYITGGGSGGRLIASGGTQLYQDSLLGGIRGALGKVSAAISAVRGAVSSVVSEVQDNLSLIISTIDQVLDSPCALASQLDSAADGFLQICGVGREVIEDVIFGACSGLAKETGSVLDGTSVPQDLGDSIVSAITDIALDFDETDFGSLVSAQQANARAITTAMQLQLLSKALQIAIITNFQQRNRYDASLAKLRAAFDTLLFRIGEYPDNTETYSATEDLRNTFFVNALNRIDTLARQIVYTVPPTIQTALHVAYNRYGDVNRDHELMNLNPIVVNHPGFLPQGEGINILDV